MSQGFMSRWLDQIFGHHHAPATARRSDLAANAQQGILVHGHQTIRYSLVRRPRKSIGFRVALDGLHVSAPSWVSVAAIEQSLREKADWIFRQQKRIEAAAQSSQDPYQDYLEHQCLPLRGQNLAIRFETRSGLRLIQEADQFPVLCIGTAGKRQSDALTRERLIAWLKKEARSDFDARIHHYAGALGFAPARWQLSSARTRWGSCNAKSVIRLNWRLIHKDPMLIDYVVVHELAHLKELNHSPRFWAIVESVLPDYRERKRLLRHDQDPVNSLPKEP